MRVEARGADPADHRADERAGLHHARRPISKPSAQRARRAGGRGDGQPRRSQFEVTDKALDFLGYRALRDLLGSLGKSSFGRHDTREQATGIETTGAPKPYEFGDTLNLDAGATLLNAVQREARDAAGGPQAGAPAAAGPGTRRIDVTYEDLMVVAGRVSELVRDGADARLQPQHDPLRRGSLHARQARRAGAGAADQHQYPGDALNVVLFHDSAEEIPLRRARPRAGRARTTRTRAKACGSRGGSSIASARTCGRSS